jgi:pimeloyl-ACP methyl ester carboxylesterase
MPLHAVNGVNMWIEERGTGPALLFVHEFGGGPKSWRRQIDHFSARYRCITFAARGYPPSDVPTDETRYGQDIATADALGVLDALDVETAVVAGLSMGAYTGLMMALAAPERVTALIAASGGSGGHPPARARFLADTLALADRMATMERLDLPELVRGPARVQLENKNPEAFAEFAAQFAEHSPLGSALTLRRVQAGRPSLHDHAEALAASPVPTLLMVGDEDEPCLDINLFLKRTMPMAGLAVMPKSGHLINLENPAAFNAQIDDFLTAVADGRWQPRDPRAALGAGAYERGA